MRVEEMEKVELSQNVYAHTHTYMFYTNKRGEWKRCQLRRWSPMSDQKSHISDQKSPTSDQKRSQK